MISASEVFAALPPFLAERGRIITSAHIGPGPVIYWMRTAVRAYENPALDVARLAADQLGRPLLIYHAISERYRYASDRHHTFILEGARDVAEALAELGISYALHVERPGHRGAHLVELARRASLVVTEDMPVAPASSFLSQLAQRQVAPIIAVDTACIVPMSRVGKAYQRAFQFRRATERDREARVSAAYPHVDVEPRGYDRDQLAFIPVDLRQTAISELVAHCEIDHGVGPVVDTHGGTTAGLARWRAFVESGLRSYARKRNDPLAGAVSRMSAYLHYGMVSPFQLARDAADHSADKYLDELLIWRELAYAYCFYTPDHASYEALPAWARSTLEKHADDRRAALYSWEQLARAQTHDDLWNAAQRSLLMHGELHNNVRMTWGKAVLQWSKSPRDAWRLLVDLNHRYALDGRDPASYAGLAWCLGGFDRPFEPEQDILGTVRPRPTSVHAQRLDLTAYRRIVDTPRHHPLHVGVIGAGMAGAIAARTLADHGLDVTLFDKGRGVSGRLATRRRDGDGFDHGAPYFTARDERFVRYVESWKADGVVAAWDAPVAIFERNGAVRPAPPEERIVGVGGNTALVKHILGDAAVELHLEVEAERVTDSFVDMPSDDGAPVQAGPFDRVVVATPAAQAAWLLRDVSSMDIGSDLMEPVWAVMFTNEAPLDVPWGGAWLEDRPLRWIDRGRTKPGRSGRETIVLHASLAWSKHHVEDAPEDVARVLFAECENALGQSLRAVSPPVAHRWRYASASSRADTGCVASTDGRVFACGDWAGGGGVEGAFLSGLAAAGQVLATRERS